MKINICQCNYETLGIDSNKNKINDIISNYESDVLSVFAPLSLSGFPLYNRNLYNDLYKQTSLAGDTLCRTNKSFIIGTPAKTDDIYYNSLVFVDNGEVRALATKRELGRFDDNFSVGNGIEVIEFRGEKLAFGFYEDILNFSKRRVAVDTIILMGETLFDKDYNNEVEKELSAYAKKLNANIIFVNRIGAQANFIFQGGSFVVNKDGEITSKLSEFKEETYLVDTKNNKTKKEIPTYAYEERIYNACVMGIRDYWRKSRIEKAVIGLSGGIDSALAVVLAVEALGKENVIGILMPSEFSSSHSINDATLSAQNLGIEYHIIPIGKIFEASKETLKELLSIDCKDTTEENLQARTRQMIVMAFGNRRKAAMINTSNKSESAVGYGTLYGDDAGALGPIGDLYKKDVYRLSRWINREKEIIPINSIEKAPSAELRPNQKDSDSLPLYDILDEILIDHIENHLSKEELLKKGYSEENVNKILHLYNINEWKRRQEAPALRLSKTCFATDFKINY